MDFEIDEPATCEHFKVLLGALSLHGRTPIEVTKAVRPGPDVPFVVPALVDLPEMVAIVSQVELSTGDTAYPIAHFSTAEIAPHKLHQPWCRSELWFKDESGRSYWTVANDRFDFGLASYIEQRTLRWVDLNRPESPVREFGDEPCPFLEIDGDRQCQHLENGERTLIGLPSGVPLNPFDE